MSSNKPDQYRALGDLLDQPSVSRVFAGFDGFVDEVIHVVDQRQSANDYTRIKTIPEYAERIAAAAGVSTNIELVPVQTKLGGNGPIYANALAQTGNDVCYVGALGEPIESVFAPLCEACREVISVANSAHTDAVEFYDGKLIVSKLASFNEVTYERLVERVGKEKLIREIAAADMLSFMNWTMIPHMSDIWRRFLEEILPEAGQGGYAFFDLADPKKRCAEHILEALELLKQMQSFRRVVLGLNLMEAKQIGGLFGVETGNLETLARGISQKTGLYGVVIHPVKEACCVIGGEYAHVDGPYCAKPVLTTGAGDNFNAGFCGGLLRGLAPEQCLMLGTATSGYYVRQAHSPNRVELQQFLYDWCEGKLAE